MSPRRKSPTCRHSISGAAGVPTRSSPLGRVAAVPIMLGGRRRDGGTRMYCSECGVQLSDAAKFCGECGTPAGSIRTSDEATLVATFGPTTGWAGKTITFEGEQFILEGFGVITAQDVAGYDRQGHLAYPYDGMRAWVLSTAAPAAPEPLPSVRAARREAQVLIFDTETSDLPRSWSRPAAPAGRTSALAGT